LLPSAVLVGVAKGATWVGGTGAWQH